jgi:DNA-binding LacI/PurR family transcriptional regulator
VGLLELNSFSSNLFLLEEIHVRPRKKVKLADIAEKSGVSVVTVSNALAGRGGVSDELRARIEACADEIGYKRDVIKKEVQEDTLFITVLSAEERKEYLLEGGAFMDCLRKAAEKHSVVLSTGFLDSRMKGHVPGVHWLSERKGIVRTDGILVFDNLPTATLRTLTNFYKLPVIGYGFVNPEVDIDYILDDSFRGMRRAVRHLTDLGDRDIIYISEEIGENKVLMDRLLGFWNAMYEYGLIDSIRIPNEVQSPEYGMEVLERRIRKGNIPDAVVCSSDETASLVQQLLNEYNLRVPGDLSLTGYRFSDGGSLEGTRFSSCVIPLNLHAEKCLELLRKRIIRGGNPDGVRFIDCRFISGESSGKHKG